MKRAIIVAPIARQLDKDFIELNILKLVRATNGTLQAWSTPDGDDPRLAQDAALTIYTTFSSMPVALKRVLVLVRRSDDPTKWLNDFYKYIADLDATDYVRTWSRLTGVVGNIGPITAKLASTMLTTDRYVRADCQFSQKWFGVSDDSLGDTN